jgi:hypothetical protein
VADYNQTEAPKSPMHMKSPSTSVEVLHSILDNTQEAESIRFTLAELGHAILSGRKPVVLAAPILAVCIYHKQDHLWKVPLLINSLFDGYRFYIRSYMAGRLETVCYAVPSPI